MAGRAMNGKSRALVRRERRYLLPTLPRALEHGVAAMVEERYIVGTGLSLRRTLTPGAGTAGHGPFLTLGQRVRTGAARSERITLIDQLSEDQYAVLARLPADVLVWRQYAVKLSSRRCALDVFSGELKGLVVAEATFSSPEEARCFRQPVFAVAEVTDDDRFSEWSLANTSTAQLAALVAEYGMLLR
jgi:CYTH domain-containing protein